MVLDCGSTNITVTAVNASGQLEASASRPNEPVAQKEAAQEFVVWDLDELWLKTSALAKQICDRVGAGRVQAVTLTTWGADGAPVASGGELTYPPICWQCPRTEALARELSERIGARRLFEITGYQVISFNTLFKLVWLRQNAPQALHKADKWMMMPGLLSWKLCEQMSIDVTSASTMMAMDLDKVQWSKELLGEAGVDESFFPPLVYPGQVIGHVTGKAADQTGLKAGTPVVAAGHDTQFAPVGSGAREDEAILSSGTWEVLMARTASFEPSEVAFAEGLLYEFDSLPGLYDPQLLMMGSGVLEWVRENLYADFEDRQEAYAKMIGDADKLSPGAGGLMMVPSFVPDAGPTRKFNTMGTITGLGLSSSRAQVYRAAVEGLCFQLKDALRILSLATGFEPQGLRVVGGGSRNELWNRLRADICRIPVAVTGHKEATVLGAALFAWVGAGRFSSVQQAQEAVATETTVIEPSEDAEVYAGLFERYRQIPPALQGFYTS